MALLKLQNIRKSYQAQKNSKDPSLIERDILQNINLEFSDNQFTMITGPSGCGKTTLLMTMGLIIPPTSGTILINDEIITHQSEDFLATKRSELIGFIFQYGTLIESINVLDNLLLPSAISGNRIQESLYKKALNLLSYFELSHQTYASPLTLSGGQKQRIAIIRAILHDPCLLLCDEPTSALDYRNATMVLETLSDLAKTPGRTVIATIHDPRFLHYADRIIQIEEGCITKDDLT
jgi:ABC-type lipoprotein export system ATPase subunit